MISCHYLNVEFFTEVCLGIIDIIRHYRLNNLVYCTQSRNLDLCQEFYNSLRNSRLPCVYISVYTSYFGGTDIEFTPANLGLFLECRVYMSFSMFS